MNTFEILNTSEVLKSARTRIADPKNWTTGCFARDAEGQEQPPRSASAVCWCAVGAIDAAAGSTWTSAHCLIFDASIELFGKQTDLVNDDEYLGHNAILKVFDRAIELAEGQAPSDQRGAA